MKTFVSKPVQQPAVRHIQWNILSGRFYCYQRPKWKTNHHHLGTTSTHIPNPTPTSELPVSKNPMGENNRYRRKINFKWNNRILKNNHKLLTKKILNLWNQPKTPYPLHLVYRPTATTWAPTELTYMYLTENVQKLLCPSTPIHMHWKSMWNKHSQTNPNPSARYTTPTNQLENRVYLVHSHVHTCKRHVNTNLTRAQTKLSTVL